MVRPFLQLSFLIVVFNFTLFAQNVQPKDQTEDLNNYWDDFKLASNSVFSLEKYGSWEVLGFSGLATLFYLSTDMELHEEYGLERENKPLGLPRVMEKIGNIYDRPGPFYFTLGLSSIMYGSGKIFEDEKLVQTTHLLLKSVIISSIFTVALKTLIGRARPHVKNDPHIFKPFNYKFDSAYLSMPSGHTSTVFAMMTVIAHQYDSWYVKIPAYTFATSVAVQRMNDKKHWISDLLIGGTLGYLVGDTIVNRSLYGSQKLSIKPLLDSRGLGLSFNF